MITDGASTKDRLLAEGMRLFALQGFRATTVGQIEAAAGLQPRRGALYRHFPSKEALLDEAVRRHLDSVRARRTEVVRGEVADVYDEALALGRYVLDELASQRAVVDVFEHEGDRVAEQRDAFREQVSDAGYRVMAEALRRWIGGDPAPGFDVDGAAVLLLGALINVHRSTWTFAGAPLGLDEARILAAWSLQCVTVVAAARS
ncbi:TetR/AcrR family transcriptional regulator [Jiangella ureilytica]|uniref:TetR/AcrR family transcriptional regulator n=1 Tax=Jiangella ureilytica TaxID=2530374 RepID=A0A4R4RJW6_9ACTN|nr:TetR/AcrR family transcriptional regulator [Jiangella ureilytica]TDC48773.1 TetR/AcrR family transcriptional regulator [Jiangella ureilytica]